VVVEAAPCGGRDATQGTGGCELAFLTIRVEWPTRFRRYTWLWRRSRLGRWRRHEDFERRTCAQMHVALRVRDLDSAFAKGLVDGHVQFVRDDAAVEDHACEHAQLELHTASPKRRNNAAAAGSSTTLSLFSATSIRVSTTCSASLP
jgi:hypothetical protein